MPLVAQIPVPLSAVARREDRRTRRARERRRRTEAAIPGLGPDDSSFRLLADLEGDLVAAGFGRPRNRAGPLGTSYCLLATPADRGEIVTVASPVPRFTASLHGVVRSFVARRLGRSERDDRIRELAQEMEEPLAPFRRSVLAALARGRSLEEIEAAVGVRDPGQSFEAATIQRLFDLSAAAAAVAALLEAGLLDGPDALSRVRDRRPWGETEIERVERAVLSDSGGPVRLLLLDRASRRPRQTVAAFLRPVVASYQTDGPEIVATLALGRDPAADLYFAVRADPPGRSLEEASRAGGFASPRRALDVLGGGADALARLHTRNLVHGDVRPGNLLLGDDGVTHLTGFGRCAVSGEPISFGREDDPTFRAPEARGRSRAAANQDVYGLAASFSGLAAPDALPEAVRHVILRARAVRPSERQPTGRELARELRAALD